MFCLQVQGNVACSQLLNQQYKFEENVGGKTIMQDKLFYIKNCASVSQFKYGILPNI